MLKQITLSTFFAILLLIMGMGCGDDDSTGTPGTDTQIGSDAVTGDVSDTVTLPDDTQEPADTQPAVDTLPPEDTGTEMDTTSDSLVDTTPADTSSEDGGQPDTSIDTSPDDTGEDEDTSCIPQCESKECGDDGCGNSCGMCGPGTACKDFVCVPVPQGECWSITLGGEDTDQGIGLVETDNGTLLAVGHTESEGNGKTDLYVAGVSSDAMVSWSLTQGGTGFDQARGAFASSTGVVAVGYTDSKGAGTFDGWIVGIDESGTVAFDEAYGGSGWDQLFDGVQMDDSSLLTVGFTESKGNGGFDMWLIKTDKDGVLQWDKTYGSSFDDEAHAIAATADNAFVMAGMTMDMETWVDVYVMKVDAQGEVIWEARFGGEELDEAQDIMVLEDGNLIVAGYTESKGAGSNDIWVLKLDAEGTLIWDKTFGDSLSDEAYALSRTSTGGIVVGAVINVFDPLSGGGEISVFELDGTGEIGWGNTISGIENEWLQDVKVLSNGGVGVIGTTTSQGAGGADILLMRLDNTAQMCN